MSIEIAIAVPDGIALAADTLSSWSTSITKAKDKKTGEEFDLAEPINIPVGWSRMTHKLFDVNMDGKKYAIITTGASHVNSKSMYAVFLSGEHKYKGNGSCQDVSKYFIDHLKKELADQLSCSVQDLSKQSRITCDYILAGYEENDVAKPVIESHIVYSGTISINNNTSRISKIIPGKKGNFPVVGKSN